MLLHFTRTIFFQRKVIFRDFSVVKWDFKNNSEAKLRISVKIQRTNFCFVRGKGVIIQLISEFYFLSLFIIVTNFHRGNSMQNTPLRKQNKNLGCEIGVNLWGHLKLPFQILFHTLADTTVFSSTGVFIS